MFTTRSQTPEGTSLLVFEKFSAHKPHSPSAEGCEDQSESGSTTCGCFASLCSPNIPTPGCNTTEVAKAGFIYRCIKQHTVIQRPLEALAIPFLCMDNGNVLVY